MNTGGKDEAPPAPIMAQRVSLSLWILWAPAGRGRWPYGLDDYRKTEYLCAGLWALPVIRGGKTADAAQSQFGATRQTYGKQR